ncbi:MAG TPA: methyltransferase domain-containing protein [Mycobacteriales bacterium]|jgi:SAM-dependent methyltransferase|nr:methyltransferase domain-containing protein [Mycobacteriales bacterium]
MPTYLQGHHESVLRSHRWRTAGNSAGYLLPHLRPGSRVLDLGCGPGTITRDLGAVVGPEGQVLGIDSSSGVVAQAAKGCDLPQVRFAVGDALHLDVGDDQYDVVHAHQVLQHLTDPVAALREMRRVTRPGGLVAVRDADYAAMTWHPASPAIDRWLEIYRAAARAHAAEPDAGRRLLGWAQAAGFNEIVPSASVWCFATPEDREWWGGMQADRIVASRIAGEAVDRGLARTEELAEMAAGWRAWAASEDGWFAVLHGELLCKVTA